MSVFRFIYLAASITVSMTLFISPLVFAGSNVEACMASRFDDIRKVEGQDYPISYQIQQEVKGDCVAKLGYDDAPMDDYDDEPAGKPAPHISRPEPEFKVSISSRTNKMTGALVPVISIVSLNDSVVIDNIIVNRGNCKFYNIRAMLQGGINSQPLNYGQKAVFESRQCQGEVLEIIVQTNLGNVQYKAR